MMDVHHKIGYHHMMSAHHFKSESESRLFKRPFVAQVENIINTWNLQRQPMMENILYPVIPPWLNLECLIEHNLVIPTTKSMGIEHNKQSVLHTLRTKYREYKQIYTDGSYSEDENRTGAAFWAPYNLTHSSWRLHNGSSIVGAEMSAIHIATSWLLQTNNPEKNCYTHRLRH